MGRWWKKLRAGCQHAPLPCELMMAFRVMMLGTTCSWFMSWQISKACFHCPAFSQVVIAALKVYTFG